MTLADFSQQLVAKSSGRYEAPSSQNMAERVYVGLKRIAKDTVPLKLVVHTPQLNDILRRLDKETFIRMPHKPVPNSEDEIDIDEELIDALGYFVLAGLETMRAKTHMGFYWSEIDANNQRLTETFLFNEDNDRGLGHGFP